MRSYSEQFNPNIPIITIVWKNNNHNELIIHINLNKFEYPIEYKCKKNNSKNIDDNKKENKNKILQKREN